MSKRAKGLSQLVGMDDIKAQISVVIAATRHTGETFPHSLLYGIGGTGKTSLALAIGSELDYHTVVTLGSALRTRDEIHQRLLAAEAESLQQRKVLLLIIDEVHQLSRERQEDLYYVMDRDRPRLIESDKTIALRPLTLVGATTRIDLLDQGSFVSRFANRWKIERYRPYQIQRILAGYFRDQGLRYTVRELSLIADRALGVPRQALTIAQTVRNIVIGRNLPLGEVTEAVCFEAFYLMDIDSMGLSGVHRKYLELLSDGHAIGLDGLAGKLGEHKDVVKGTIEPILLSLNMVNTTPKGRVITAHGLRHLKQRP